jgi:cytochrome c
MDSFEINKIAGAVLGTLTLTLGLVIASEGLFHSEVPEKPGYELPGAEAKAESEGGGQAATAVEPIAVRLASADAAKGEAVAKRCSSCHAFEEGGPNKVGPDLYNIVNRARASGAGFAYSAPMKAKGGNWTYDDLDHFLDNPKGFIPGTAMSFAGLKKPEERANIIAYLRTLSHSPVPLPAGEGGGQASGGSGTPVPADGKPAH